MIRRFNVSHVYLAWTFDVLELDSIRLQADELVCSIASVTDMFGYPCFAVGTAVPTEKEEGYLEAPLNEQGRLIFVRVTTERKLDVVHELRLKGDISSLKLLQSNNAKPRLVVGIKGKVR